MNKLIARLQKLIAKLQGKNNAPAPVAPAPTLPIYHIPGPALPAAPTPAPPANSIPPLVVPAGFPPDHPDAWPRIVEFKGVKIKLNAPVNELWEPSMEARTFGKYGAFVADPSNAPPGYPNRTPAGFPIHYGGVHFDVSKGAWAGEPMAEWGIPFGGQVLFPNGRSDVDTVNDYLGRVAVRDENLRQNDRETANTVYVGPFAAKNLIHGPNEGREAAFIHAADCLAFERGGGTELITRRSGLFSGTHAEVSLLINYGEQEQIYEHKSYQQTVEDFPDTPVKRAVMAVLDGLVARA